MRVIKILLYLFLLFMIYIWLSTFFKSCNSDNVITNAVDTIEETTDDLVDEGGEILEDAEEFFEEDEEINYEELDADQDFEDEDIYEEDAEEFEDLEPDPVEKPAPAPVQSKPTVRSSSNGSYFVITGSYLLKSNANDMKTKLDRLGHDAEILNFDDSEYHAVTSGRYRSYEDATSVSRKLSGKGIDNYVHRRK